VIKEVLRKTEHTPLKKAFHTHVYNILYIGILEKLDMQTNPMTKSDRPALT